MRTKTAKGASWTVVPSVTIEPNSSVEFAVSIGVGAAPGASQVVIVSGKTNDPNHPNWELPIRIARVTDWVTSEPTAVVFDSTQVPFQPIQKLIIYANGDDTRQITGAKPFPPERFITRVQPAPAGTPPHPTAGKAIGLIEVELKSLPPGPVWGQLAIEVDGQLPDEKVHLPITGEVPSAETPTK
ncbi:hypothetical protein [Tuwongella immobilis]|nr:hypothetical protein [Tuwongella immobilis]